MRDRDTGNPRGFAFVVFKEDSTIDLVMENLPHEINHKVVDVKRAQARGAAPPSIHGKMDGGGGGKEQAPGQDNSGGGGRTSREMSPEELQNKIFVGGLPLHLDNDGMKEFFSQFGNVTDAIVMMDMAQGRSRGFGFVTFENGSGGAQKALDSQPIHIDNKYVEIKLATPKGKQSNTNTFSNAGLRNANAAAVASSQSKGEFAGFAASYGRNGWKAGYGSYAFGSCGWAVRDWETFLDVPEKSGFSFDLVTRSTYTNSRTGSKDRTRDRTTSRKREHESFDQRDAKRNRS